jgi:hypothetical protein
MRVMLYDILGTPLLAVIILLALAFGSAAGRGRWLASPRLPGSAARSE